MLKLTELIAQVERDTEQGPNVKGPMFSSYCDIYHVFSEVIDPLKNKPKDKEVPTKVQNALVCAFAWGASSALQAVKYGRIADAVDGKVSDRTFYSIDELLAEALMLQDPEATLDMLREDLEDIQHDPETCPDCQAALADNEDTTDEDGPEPIANVIIAKSKKTVH